MSCRRGPTSTAPSAGWRRRSSGSARAPVCRPRCRRQRIRRGHPRSGRWSAGTARGSWCPTSRSTTALSGIVEPQRHAGEAARGHEHLVEIAAAIHDLLDPGCGRKGFPFGGAHQPCFKNSLVMVHSPIRKSKSSNPASRMVIPLWWWHHRARAADRVWQEVAPSCLLPRCGRRYPGLGARMREG